MHRAKDGNVYFPRPKLRRLLAPFVCLSVPQEGDILVDGGNEWFPNSQRRAEELESKKILFVGMGISGGEEGARNGPSLMPGGPKEAFDQLAPIITKCAAQVRRCILLFYMLRAAIAVRPPPPTVQASSTTR